MVMYARSDVRQFIPPGAVCKGHDRPADRKSKHPITGKVHLSVSCSVCEPILARDQLWANALSDVPLTESEKNEVEQQKAQSNSAMAAFSMEFISGYQTWLANQQQGKK